jgi:YHS domain-containing protein
MSRKAFWTITAVVVATAILAFAIFKFSGKAPGQETHATCPVCQMTVDPATAPKSVYKGKTYYFCSGHHKQEFDATPAKFVDSAALGP